MIQLFKFEIHCQVYREIMQAKEENIFRTIPQEVFHRILDLLSLNQTISLRGVSVRTRKMVDIWLAEALKIRQLSCGQNHSLVLLERGRVLLLKHKSDDVNSLSEILNIDPVTFISTGFSHSLMLNTMNEVWALGDNSEKQLPSDLQVPGITCPQKSGSVKNIKYAVANNFTTSVLTIDQNYQTFGQSNLKPLLVKNGLRLLPDWVSIPQNFDIIDVSAGDAHVLILTSTGECYGMGSNENGLLGLRTEIKFVETWQLLADKIRQIKATSLGSFILTNDNTLMATGMNVKQQLSTEKDTVISSFRIIATGIKTFEASDHHTLYVDLCNQLHTLGYVENEPTTGQRKPSPGNFIANLFKAMKQEPEQPMLVKKIGNLNSFFKLVTARPQQDPVEFLDNNFSGSTVSI